MEANNHSINKLKVRRWWQGSFYMKKNNLTYIGSIKKMSNNSVEIVLTNKVYNFTHVMWTNFDEILFRARSLVPKLLSMTSASVSVDDNALIKCLPEMIELREREEEEEEEKEKKEKVSDVIVV